MLGYEWLRESLREIHGTTSIALGSRCIRRSLVATVHLPEKKRHALSAIADVTAQVANGNFEGLRSKSELHLKELESIKENDVGALVASVALSTFEAAESCTHMAAIQNNPEATSGRMGSIINTATGNHYRSMSSGTTTALLNTLKAIESASATISARDAEHAQLAVWSAIANDVIEAKYFMS